MNRLLVLLRTVVTCVVNDDIVRRDNVVVGHVLIILAKRSLSAAEFGLFCLRFRVVIFCALLFTIFFHLACHVSQMRHRFGLVTFNFFTLLWSRCNLTSVQPSFDGLGRELVVLLLQTLLGTFALEIDATR